MIQKLLLQELQSLPAGANISNWCFASLSNPSLQHLRITSASYFFSYELMFTIYGSTGIILGNAAVDLGLHDTYYVAPHVHGVLFLRAVILSGITFNGEMSVGTELITFILMYTLAMLLSFPQCDS